jgi:hypothetical protein
VPRYCAFEPGEADNIYADKVALVRITCQGCAHAFKVCYSSTNYDTQLPDREDLASYLRFTALEETFVELEGGGRYRREFAYGDPPNINCCAAGPTMTAVPDLVLEFWRRNSGEWERVPELEIAVTPSWAENTSWVENTAPAL